jgi:hypothetical protein
MTTTRFSLSRTAADRYDAALGIQHRRHHCRGQAGTHRGKRIVEQ